MTLTDLASIGTLVSSVAVLVSVIYLAQQTRQNTRHTRALIHQGRVTQASDYLARFAADPALLEAVGGGFAGDERLSDIQIARYHFTQISQFLTIEDHYFQHRDGLIADTRHNGLMRSLRNWFRTPGFRASWMIARGNFDGTFQDFMDAAMNEVEVAPPFVIASAWRTLAAAERKKADDSQ